MIHWVKVLLSHYYHRALTSLLIDAWSSDNELCNELVHLSLGQDSWRKVTKQEDVRGAQELSNRAMHPSKKHLCSVLNLM